MTPSHVRADLLKKAGIAAPPTTWDEVIQQATAVKKAGLSEHPLLIPLAAETRLIEHIYTLVYSRGGYLFDANRDPVFQTAGSEALDSLKWLIEAMHTHKVVSTGALETGEIAAFKAFTGGKHAFALLPNYRLRVINDPKQSSIAGQAKEALMPSAMRGKRETVAWTRMFSMTPPAARDRAKAEASWRLIEWFGGRDDAGAYKTAKEFMVVQGTLFGAKPLFEDAEVKAFIASWGDIGLIERQLRLTRTKDGLTPWFAEWDTFNRTAWHKALLRQTEPAEALKQSAAKWADLKKSWKS